MASLLASLTELALRYPRRVLAVAGLLLVLGGIAGAPVAEHLSSGGFTDPDSDSTRSAELIDAHADALHGGQANLVFVVTAPGGVDDPAAGPAAERIQQVLAEHPEWLGFRQDYWHAPEATRGALRSEDGEHGLVLAHVRGDDNEMQVRAGWFDDHVDEAYGEVRVQAGGAALAYHQVNDNTKSDLTRAELIAVPLTALALVLVFGSLVAALMPLAVGVLAIIGTLAVLRALATVTDVSIYALNMTTALGLALAIDYSLFMVSRYREELAGGREQSEAIRVTVATAGRTVLFSAVTVALALAALAVFPMYFLRSFAYAGLAVVALAALASLIVLPAVLQVLGPRVNALDLRGLVRRALRRPVRSVGAGVAADPERSAWFRVATAVMRRPTAFGLAVVALLLVLGSPFLRAEFGYPDDRVLRDDMSARAVGDLLREDFAQNAAAGLTGVAQMPSDPEVVAAYTAQVSRLDGVTSATSSAGRYVDGRQVGAPPEGYSAEGVELFSVASGLDPFSGAGSDLVHDLRTLAHPLPGDHEPIEVLWGGAAAFDVDAMHGITEGLPIALGLIALATVIVLFLFTGSVVVPLKALLLNLLSLTATFGAMVWVFQDGHLSDVLGFTPTGYLVANMVVLMFCLAFGMSMDYEVFLLSRIREEWAASAQTSEDNTRAVALGLARTGRIVTAAAALMAIVFAAMVSSTVQFMQLFGLGLTLAVLADATLVRGVLVPAFMRLMGRANWWAPRPLARLHARFGLSEES